MLKGHTKIELTNVNTGEVKVVEDDNLVTNAMSKMFETMPYCGYSASMDNPFNSSTPFIDRFCGGILLFRDQIEENPENWLMPKGNKMVGNARVNYASAQNVPEFGAFNAEESTWDVLKGERKYVYDFSTAKANGTISCVALTNFLTGYWGMGNTSGKRESMTVEDVNYSNSDLSTRFFWGSHTGFPTSTNYSNGVTFPSFCEPLFADYDQNAIYVFSRYAFVKNSTYDGHHVKYGTFKVSKLEFPFHSLNPMSKFGEERAHKIVKQIDIPVPSEIASLNSNYTSYHNICRTDDAVYIVFSNSSSSVEADQNFYVWKIGYDLETSEVLTVKNTTGTDIAVRYYEQTSLHIHDGYLICCANSGNRMFKIKLSDPTDVIELENFVSDGYPMYYFMNFGNVLIARSVQYQNRTAIVNLNDNTVSPFNGNVNFGGNDYYLYSIIPIRGKDNFFIKAYGNSMNASSTYIIYNPFFLSTINNLPEPVVKTSDMTMKITYTLTGIGDEEGDD